MRSWPADAYLGSCALGPWITPADDIADPYDIGITLTIERGGSVAWQGQASTSERLRGSRSTRRNATRLTGSP